MICSYGVKSLRYNGEELGCRVELQVDGESYCALDFRKSTVGLKVDEVMELRKTDMGYFLTDDEITGSVDVLDADGNDVAFQLIHNQIRWGTHPEISDFMELCISNYLVRNRYVEPSSIQLVGIALLFWKYKGLSYKMEYLKNESKVVIHRKGYTQAHSIILTSGSSITKKGFLKDCSMVVGVLEEEILK